MRVASPEEQQELTGLSAGRLERLRQMREEGASLDALLEYLQSSGVAKPAASIALCLAHVLESLSEARSVVENSPAYADWPSPLAKQAAAEPEQLRAVASAA